LSFRTSLPYQADEVFTDLSTQNEAPSRPFPVGTSCVEPFISLVV